MRTNVVLNDHLMDEAFQYAEGIRTKRELIETALREFVKNKKMKKLSELKGKIIFTDNYDYKKMREGK
ncbi:MAG: type II toxin-antitoxin system VapB family antitoxin [Acidobacteria bacterium]|nr:type II toxin-antitoxin system VapB family antitoxin [Acidobacteriota bacterium]